MSALRLLAPAIALYPAAYIAGDLLVSQMRQNAVSVVYVVVMIQNILPNLFLIPRWSLNGAAAGTSISQALATELWSTCRCEPSGVWTGDECLLDRLWRAWSPGGDGRAANSIVVALAAAAVLYVVSLVAFERFAFPEDARGAPFDLARRA